MIAVPSPIISDPIFFEQIVSVTTIPKYYEMDLTSSFRDIIKAIEDYSMNTPVTALKNKISELSQLSSNWDGYDASAIPEKVIANCYKFIDTLIGEEGRLFLSPDDITPTSYGSLVFDMKSPNGLVSLEIGKTKIGFFTEYTDYEDFESEGEETDFRSIPTYLNKAIEILYGRKYRNAC